MEEVFFDFYSFASLRFMHVECFELWQDNILAFVSKLKDGGKRGKQQWTEKQKVSEFHFLKVTLSVSRRVCGGSPTIIWQWKFVDAAVAR